MIKLIAGMFLVLAAYSSQAVTFLPESGWGLLKQFHNIPNDEGVPGLYLYLSTTNPGINYFQADDSGSIIWTCNGTADQSESTSATPLSCSDGVVRTITYYLHHVTVIGSCSGRGCNTRRTYWYLDSGYVNEGLTQ